MRVATFAADPRPVDTPAAVARQEGRPETNIQNALARRLRPVPQGIHGPRLLF